MNNNLNINNKLNMDKYSTFEPNINYQGNTYFYGNVANPETCKGLCLNQTKCNGWTFNKTNKECQLKNQITGQNNSIYMVGGLINNNNNLLQNNMPVTLNRFGNNTKNTNPQKMNPYFVTGVPVDNNTTTSTVSTDNSVPFNGKSNNLNNTNQTNNFIPNKQPHAPNNENYIRQPYQRESTNTPVPYNAPNFSQYGAPEFSQ